MPEKGSNVVGNIRKFIRNRSRSPGGNSRSGGFGSALGLLHLEPSPIDQNQNTPKIFNTLVRQLRPHIATEGLFRVSVPNRVLQQLKAKIEIDRLDNNADPHVLACGLKAWLRELPQGLIPPPFQDQLLLSANNPNDIRRVISTLPELNKATLNLLFELLNCVSTTDKNRMTAGALAVVVGPSLFRVQATSEGLQTTQKTNEVAMKFIKDYQTFRPEFSSQSIAPHSPIITNIPKIVPNQIHVNGSEDAPILEDTPPPSPTPLAPDDLKKVIDDTIDRALNSTDNDTPRSPNPTGSMHGSPDVFTGSESLKMSGSKETGSSGGSSTSSHQRLRLPSRPVPLRGSRRKPSRNRIKTTSQESTHESTHTNLKINSNQENGQIDTNVYARLGDGESLEGWRIESTPNTSLVATPADTPSQTPQSVIIDRASDAVSKSPDNQLAPKPPPLDLSPLALDSPAMSPRTVPKSVLSDTESLREDFTAVNTPRTSPEPDLQKYSSCPNDSSVANSPVNNFNRSLTKDNSTRRKHSSKSKVKNQPSNDSSHRHKKQLSSESDVKKQRGRSPRKTRDAKADSDNHVAQLSGAVVELEKRMMDKREISCRTEVIDEMTELQLREEKSELQRELLILEGTFGRPNAGPERQVVRLVYHRYRELKKRLSRLDNRSANDREAFLREIESELSKIERERRDLGKSIKSWEAQFRIENSRNPTTDEKIGNQEYSRYRHLKSRRNFLQDLQQQTAPESFTV